jgi:hypothetical protein
MLIIGFDYNLPIHSCSSLLEGFLKFLSPIVMVVKFNFPFFTSYAILLHLLHFVLHLKTRNVRYAFLKIFYNTEFYNTLKRY